MSLYLTLHLHNVPAGREDEYAGWFDDRQGRLLANLRGFREANRYEVTPQQVMFMIPQPWRFLSVYEFDLKTPEIDLPAMAPILAEARDMGLIADDATERVHSYQMYSEWKGSPNWQRDKPLSGVSIILGNYVAGREAEYHQWYDDVHSVEVSNVPGHVAMRRGHLTDVQVAPRHYCPGDQLVMCAQQTDDLAFTVKDFSARANGRSPSGIAMAERSDAGSFARTVHYFRKISGVAHWQGGIAYAGNMAPYEAAKAAELAAAISDNAS